MSMMSLFDVGGAYPPYPSTSRVFQAIISRTTFETTLSAKLPLTFSVCYYLMVHQANHLIQRHGNRDFTKGATRFAKFLRSTILIHNATLAIYSAYTFTKITPPILDFLLQGWNASHLNGVSLALCSMPINSAQLGAYTYVFYLSKYYEVIDSAILLVQGKKVTKLQSYHHSGAIVCMWIAYRHSSQPIWIFCMFNSFVHTLMYTYYLFTSMHFRLPTRLKRNLTTLQISQIFIGTLLTNLHLLLKPNPYSVISAFEQPQEISSFHHHHHHHLHQTDSQDWCILFHAQQRLQRKRKFECLDTHGKIWALHVNTLYMFPLLALFFNFFIRSYLQNHTN